MAKRACGGIKGTTLEMGNFVRRRDEALCRSTCLPTCGKSSKLQDILSKHLSTNNMEIRHTNYNFRKLFFAKEIFHKSFM